MSILPRLLLSCCWALCAGAAGAGQTADAGEEPSPQWRLGLALGYGAKTNPLIQSHRVSVPFNVDIAWFGKHWFFDNGDLGLTLFDGKAATVSLVGRVNSERVFFGRTESQLSRISAVGQPLDVAQEVKPPERHYAVEAGIEIMKDGRWGQLNISAYRDASGTHEGFDAGAEYSYRWHGARWVIQPHVSARFKSAALNDYYWGVKDDEANPALPAYHAGSGVTLGAGARTSYHLTPHVRLAASVSWERLPSAITHSPIVKESHVLGWFAGLAYRF
jgi:outer membrane protein